MAWTYNRFLYLYIFLPLFHVKVCLPVLRIASFPSMTNLCGPSTKLEPVHDPVVPLPQSNSWPPSSEHLKSTSSLDVHLMVGVAVLRSVVDPITIVGAVLSKNKPIGFRYCSFGAINVCPIRQNYSTLSEVPHDRPFPFLTTNLSQQLERTS